MVEVKGKEERNPVENEKRGQERQEKRDDVRGRRNGAE